MIIDVHSHILPGIDDGAKDMEETIEMLNMAVEEGIEAIIATPHCEVGMGHEHAHKCREAYDTVSNYIETHKIPLQLYMGNEIYYSESIPELLQSGEMGTMNDTRYILVEFPMHIGYQMAERALVNLLYAGYWPIIAHVERYSALRNWKKIYELVRIGVYIQVNAGSIIGKEGWLTRRFCKQLMRRKLVHVIGTDAHGSRHRCPMMKMCFEYIDKRYGRNYRKQMSEKNPLRILKGEKISGKD